ncbi:uncharacterized protein LOC131943953 [Physella acuta]|uniref:uncharacterized protein LOC131943953 n=1 Tax=Physella acuta TaxID=109671 RepID=UPI0027DDAFBF|nr:uncharacterized protein LOC131943953 [Physella acuta]
MIRQLPDDVRAALRTGVALSSFSQAVEELVLNSIDAGASSVAVRVDLQLYKIQVIDNGCGITLDQFPLVGERYATSKCAKLEDLKKLKYFGYRGEALASLRHASTFLEIVSKAGLRNVTYCKCFQEGISLGVQESAISRPAAGTTVTAHNLFYKLPVRRNRLKEGLELEQIRHRVAGVSLMWPHVSFSVRDDSVGHVILQTHKCSSPSVCFSHLFSAARNLVDVAMEKGDLSISASISKDSYSRKDLQFIFINKRLILKSCLHQQVNKILSSSLIVRSKGRAAGEGATSPAKTSERCAMYVINVTCPHGIYDVTFEPSKTLVEFENWGQVLAALEELLYAFLRRENLFSLSEPCAEGPNGRGVSDGEGSDEGSKSSSCLEKFVRDNDQVASCSRSEKIANTVSDFGLFSKSVCRSNPDIPSVPLINSADTSCSPGIGTTLLHTDIVPVLSSSQSAPHVCSLLSDKELPIHKKPVPVDETPVPVDETPVPVDETPVPVDETPVPVDESPVPVDETPVPVDETPVQVDETPVQVDETPVPVDETPVPVDETPVPVDESPVPVDETPVPVDETLVPVDETPVPVDETPVPVDDLPPPMNKTPVPVDETPAPMDESPVPVCKSPAVKKLVTLGKSVNYCSTLQVLREKGKVPEIISNTLQRLRDSTHLVRQAMGDLYKTPQTSTKRKLSQADPIHDCKISRILGQHDTGRDQCVIDGTCLTGRELSRNNDQHTRAQDNDTLSSEHKKKGNLSSTSDTLYHRCKSSTNSRWPTDGHTTRPNKGRQGPADRRHKMSQATKLVKLMSSQMLSSPMLSTFAYNKLTVKSCLTSPVLSTPQEKSSVDYKFHRLPDQTHRPPDQTPGLPDQTPGPPGQTPGPHDQTCVSPDQTPGPPDQTPGPPGQTPGPPDQTPGPPDQTPGPPGQTPGPPGTDPVTVVSLHPMVNGDLSNWHFMESYSVPLVRPEISTKDIKTCTHTSARQCREAVMKADSALLEQREAVMKADSALLEQREAVMKADSALLEQREAVMEADSALLEQSEAVMKADSALLEQREAVIEADSALLEQREAVMEADSALLEQSEAVMEADSALLEQSEAVMKADSALLEQREAVMEADSALLEQREAVMEADLALLEQSEAVMEADSALLEQMEADSALLEQREAVMEADSVLLEQREAVMEADSALLEQREAVMEADSALLEKREAVMEADSALLEQREAWCAGGAPATVSATKHCCQINIAGVSLNGQAKQATAIAQDQLAKQATAITQDPMATQATAITQDPMAKQATAINQDPLDKQATAITQDPVAKECGEKETCWRNMLDGRTGQRIFVNTKSGHTLEDLPTLVESSSLPPESSGLPPEKPSNPVVQLGEAEKIDFHHSINQLLTEATEERACKWRGGKTLQYDTDRGADISLLLSKWTNPVLPYFKQSDQESWLNNPMAKAAPDLPSVELTKDDLNHIQVIGQVDNKFIACMLEGCSSKSQLLVLFDQHAVHERIRLEFLTQECYEERTGEDKTNLCRSKLPDPLEVTLDPDDIRLMKSFSTEFDRIGVKFSLDEARRNVVHIHTVPACLAEASKKNQVPMLLEHLIKEHIDLLKCTNGACGRLPLVIHKILCSTACHGAVKFGDRLDLKDCQLMLATLAKCQLPFQCAHGRPSVAPLVTMATIEQEALSANKVLNLWKISPNVARRWPCQ